MPPPREPYSLSRLLQRQRDEPQFAVRADHQEQRRLAAFFLELVDPGLEFVGGSHRFLRDLNNDIAGRQTLVGSR